MHVSDKLNEIFYWAKEELSEIINDIELEKGEEKIGEIYKKIKNTIKVINDSNSLENIHNNIERKIVKNKNIINWNDLNFCLFYYINIYKKIYENLYIEEEDFFCKFDTYNYFVKKNFQINLVYHPLIYSIDSSYFNFLFSFIFDGYKKGDKNLCINLGKALCLEKNKDNEIAYSNSEKTKQHNGNNFIIDKNGNEQNYEEKIKEPNDDIFVKEWNIKDNNIKKNQQKYFSRNKITYILNDNVEYKQNFIITNESHFELSEMFTKNGDVYKYIENVSDSLYNFGYKKGIFDENRDTFSNPQNNNNLFQYLNDSENEDVNNINNNGNNFCDKNKRIDNEQEEYQKTDIGQAYNYSIKNKTYMVDKELNKKIKIYNGDIANVESQGIILYANNNYKYSKSICENLYSSNLMKLEEEEKYEIRTKKSGEVYLTNSYDNIHKYILHVMLPKYNSKFILATHNTMNLCVHEILYACFEKKIQSISIPIVCFSLFFPINIFLITLLKSLRSLLLIPQFYNTIKNIIFVTNSNNIYFFLLKYISIFFPRTEQERFLSTNIAIIGNKIGSIDVQNRNITIFKSLRKVRKKKRKKKIEKKNEYYNKVDINLSGKNEIKKEEYIWDSDEELSSDYSNSSCSSTSEIFKEADTEFLNIKTQNESHKNFLKLTQINRNDENINLECYLRLSYNYNKKEKFEELKKMNFIYEYGIDEFGRNIIIINFCNFPLIYNYNLLYFYLIYYFNTFMRNQFILLFIFSESILSNITNILSLFKDIFQVIQEFLKNIKIIYFFNYSFMFKFFIYVLYPFIPPDIYENIVYLNDDLELSKYFDVRKVLKRE
ncbi:conserved Plasmodium protein, unknown function [Plasmodium berghei]|uniref:Macro domain-containing protein n=2 Tax=Plasmodium berghei TaxID=5821 RepID=A0A509AFT0_PLABA|nr:conserved Plasmodium protein, unknown function [Plasmodium berghei ANKA]CXI18821.1 conserved Plasmodium protein, unknown function [Plasmodium berghei]SCM19804.1 conserved Plasmodium protein, unknown function [Plasmodium berghei]SCN23544.1 conserved Plasmodium protein, unknown function [Plasmodium berghei]SCO59135.1 conserved Plasmodium protein, unknown function [Plasmodium berghei]SCO59873.1 conserved Plasmodium protein, unknown function [Plasmodium berghei]|eukprot:XP_034420648.1 conserved Plasmodium protein, unknown function [Plasmodium berghei ANKA]